jgi:8-oxo-dGTP pyrophosphatase MutT (NUDIX family)
MRGSDNPVGSAPCSRPHKEFAHAVILVSGAYVLQLRDDIPGIAYPGMWTLFGGALEPDEEPGHGLRREITEELGIMLNGCRLLWQVDRFSEFWRQPVRHWFFVADATDEWPSHVVREGKAAGLFRFEELPRQIVPLAREAIQHHSRSLGDPV